jgi:hypothetical protein
VARSINLAVFNDWLLDDHLTYWMVVRHLLGVFEILNGKLLCVNDGNTIKPYHIKKYSLWSKQEYFLYFG